MNRFLFSFLVVSLRFCIYYIMISANIFTSYFQFWTVFISFFSLIAVTRTSTITLLIVDIDDFTIFIFDLSISFVHK